MSPLLTFPRSVAAVPCEYFALCDHEAVGTTPHPILGPVPICTRCAEKLDLPVDPLEVGE